MLLEGEPSAQLRPATVFGACAWPLSPLFVVFLFAMVACVVLSVWLFRASCPLPAVRSVQGAIWARGREGRTLGDGCSTCFFVMDVGVTRVSGEAVVVCAGVLAVVEKGRTV